MKILKFGGKSLSNGLGIQNSLSIITKESNHPIMVVVSARGKATDELENLLELAASGLSYQEALRQFIQYQSDVCSKISLQNELEALRQILNAVGLLGEYSTSVKDRVLAFGELISAQTVVHLLRQKGLNAVFVDARELIKTTGDEPFKVLHQKSETRVKELFKKLPIGAIPVVTGFIASNLQGVTTTLGRNGSNYTATLLAQYCNAAEVQNWTDIDGIYTADPALVKSAKRISSLTYREANELANFGANILHAKTIFPLIEKKIPIRILNTFKPELPGTTVNDLGAGKGIKAVSLIKDVSLVSIEGRGLMGKVGIDARIFSALSRKSISVRMISQASSERGIGFIVNQRDALLAKETLEKEFSFEINHNDVSKVDVNSDLAIVAIIGRHNFALEKAIAGLRKNRIWMYLINNSINGEHISLVVSNNDLKKAVNVVHNHVFGVNKILNVLAFGKGTVGGTLIDQVLETREEIIEKRNLKLNIVGVVDSQHFLFQPDGVDVNWRNELAKSEVNVSNNEIIKRIHESGLENLVIVDNTASSTVVYSYFEFVKNGFDIIASNKLGNSMDYTFYQNLRTELNKKGKSFLYETNVGAGLPLIDTLRLLHLSGEEIEKIKGVFSGSLSYIFNHFSLRKDSFSNILNQAKTKGFTEPDPREDLSGNDVARKLLILAREIGMQKEFSDVQIANLIPDEMLSIQTWEDFEKQFPQLDQHYSSLLEKLPSDKVFRYLGELSVDGHLRVELKQVAAHSPLGNVTGSDSIFEIYTKGYGDNPIVIQGAGAGAQVTARGVYADLLRVGSRI